MSEELTVRKLTEAYLLGIYKLTNDHLRILMLPTSIYRRLVLEICSDINWIASSGTWMSPVGPIELRQEK